MKNFISTYRPLLWAAAGASCLFSISSSEAQLISLTSNNFTIFANGYSSSTIDANSSSSSVSSPGSTLVTDPSAPTGTKEDTWGIFQITSITQGTSPATPVFTDNGGVEYWGIFYNSYDVASGSTPLGNLEFASKGLKLDIYKVNVLDTGDVFWKNVYTTTSPGAERIGQSGYQGISDVGTLVLSSSLSGTMGASYNPSIKTTNATGNLDVGFNTLLGGPGQISNLSFSLGGNTISPPVGWNVSFGGPIEGSFSAVPEPSTWSLMGVCALMGIVAFRRFKKSNPVA